MSVLTAPEGHPDHCSLCRVKHMAKVEADLRDRLALFAGHVCQGCGCAPAAFARELCIDCDDIDEHGANNHNRPEWLAPACISVGMRALAGRRILEGVT